MNSQTAAVSMPLCSIIQGGMGVGVSNWKLARTVSRAGQLGVVSGTALGSVLARRLQCGDSGGWMREALQAFPLPEIAERIIRRYFVAGGKKPDAPFRGAPMPDLDHREAAELALAGNFVEVHLAKRGHSGWVGLNLLEKIQTPTLPSLFGAILAGVDVILMGAGIPRTIPAVLDKLADNQAVSLRIDAVGAERDAPFFSHFDPTKFGISSGRKHKRPAFIAIVSSHILAKTLALRSEGTVNGFVVEGCTAGGHNAPPRGPLVLNPGGEPVFGLRDQPDLEVVRSLGLPFWLAGGYGQPGKLAEALALGATGVQAGTAFAFCEESGLSPEFRRETIRRSRENSIRVFTDPKASPTGYPFKVLPADNSLSEEAVYQARERVCDLGYLRTTYQRPDGSPGYRCPGEPEANYVRKGGVASETTGRKCVCNGLMSAIGLGQMRNGKAEPPLFTAGDDVSGIAEFLSPGRNSYHAADVIRRLLSGTEPA